MDKRSVGLIDFVFSWSIQDALDVDLYKGQVKKIPETFTSTTHYFNSLLAPLVEETHADLFSALTRLSRAPSYQLSSIENETNHRAPTHFYYHIVLKRPRNSNPRDSVSYRPQNGDIAALTDVRPTCISELNRPRMPYILAYVQVVDDDKLYIRSSKPIMIERELQRTGKDIDIFFVFLTNVTTNIRIWKALNQVPLGGGNLQMIEKVIEMNAYDEEDCDACLSENDSVTIPSFESYGLNDSQEAAIASCIRTWRCHHQNSVKLIWGPPGTGKTKTISSLLSVLLGMKCRTIMCAPTLIAVMELASRVMSLVSRTLEYKTYGLGDIVLFGSSDRMGMDDDHHKNMLRVFLDYRVKMLDKCFSPSTGWNTSLLSMIDLLEDPRVQYGRYIAHRKLRIDVDEYIMESDPLTLEEFVKKIFVVYNERLKFCVVNLCTHLPTNLVSLSVVKNMMVALDSLKSTEASLKSSCLPILKSLAHSFRAPDCTQKFMIKRLCVDNACLLFCTASSSFKLHTERTQPLDLLVIDEAAQLKECESAIPFQLPGLRCAVLIGDERQLPAMIRSKVCGEAEYGRSMFERLVLQGHKRQLFNVQYRMHPAISSFPNREFYDGLILDAEMVKHSSHEKRFLHGNMYGAYSFINVAYGKEQFDHLFSKKNMVEVDVVCSIVSSLFKEFTATKQRISIGVISPYTAQVRAIQEKLEKNNTGCSSDSRFSVRIRSVDGFQGGEEDVIIISTVRSNINGSLGFLSDRQRVNVALTRARHCLWIVGNEATLIKRDSVWTRLVTDAKRRGCFYNADEDKHLSEAIITSLINLQQFERLLSMDSPVFKHARWRVCFGNDLKESAANIKNKEIHKQMIKVLAKLANGWHDDQNKEMMKVHAVDSGELNLSLVWSVDIEMMKENSEWIQILKVWDIVPLLDVPKAAHKLNTLFGKYTQDKISRCKYQCLEGNLVVPMKWEVEDRLIEGNEDDKMLQCLSRQGHERGNEDDKMLQCLSRQGHERGNEDDKMLQCLSRYGHEKGNEDDKMLQGLSRYGHEKGNEDDKMLQCLSRYGHEKGNEDDKMLQCLSRYGHEGVNINSKSISLWFYYIIAMGIVIFVSKYIPWPIFFPITFLTFIIVFLIQH